MPEKNDVFFGIGYVVGIRDPVSTDNVHARTDILRVVAYQTPTENFDYTDARRVIESDNGLTFYSKRIDKTNKPGIVWGSYLRFCIL